MKNILVPTDFSATAENAFDCAITLAKKLNCNLILVHAYQVPAPIAEVSFGVLNDERRALKEESEDKLRSLSIKINYAGNIGCDCISVEGEAADCILKVAVEKKADMIIMGNTGQNGLNSVIFGHVSLRVMENAQCPVITIPSGSDLTETIKHITYATDYLQSDLAAINVASKIAAAFGAQLNILHISDAIVGGDEEKTLMSNFMNEVNMNTDYPYLSFQIVHGDDVMERLEQYIEDKSTGMLIMSTHYRSFFDKLFGVSITKNITSEGIAPIVAFHYNTKTAVKVF